MSGTPPGFRLGRFLYLAARPKLIAVQGWIPNFPLADTHFIRLFQKRSATAADHSGAVATNKRISDCFLAGRTV
jgi:hypothetical protein